MKYVKTGLFITSLVLMMNGICAAQAFKVIKATSQHWAGGVVGRSGITYVIELETSSHITVPDTVWINGYVYPIDSFAKDGQYSRSIDSVTKHTLYSIMITEAHNRFNNRRPPIPEPDTTAEKSKHIRPTPAGTALISYKHKKKEEFFMVKSFAELKQLNYP